MIKRKKKMKPVRKERTYEYCESCLFTRGDEDCEKTRRDDGLTQDMDGCWDEKE